MKILLTGSNGLLGQKLVELLANDPSVELVATARGHNRLPIKVGYTYQQMDVCNKEEVCQVISMHSPDVVIHTAAMTNVDQCELEKEGCWQQNVYAVDYLVQACNTTGSHLEHLSTDFIFDGTEGPLDENAEANPISFYGWSKLAAEKLIMQHSKSWAIARTILVYGVAADMSRSNIILWVKSSLEAGKEIKVVNDQWRTPTLAEDLAKGCIILAESKAQGVFNVAGKDLLTPYQMAIKTADFFKLNKDLIKEVDGTQFTQTAKRPARTGLKIDKMKAMSYVPVSFEEGISIVAAQIK